MAFLAYSFIFQLFIISCLVSNNLAFRCVQALDDCRCKTNSADNEIIDLHQLDSHSAFPKFQSSYPGTDGKQWTIEYNPCTPYYCQSKQTAAACITNWYQGFVGVTVGEMSSAKFVNTDDPYSIVMRYTASDPNQGRTFQTDVTFKCQQTATNPQYTITSFVEQKVLNLAVTTNVVCLKNPPASESSSGGGLSFGSILLIICASLVIVYFVGGLLVMKFYFNESGVRIVPNVEIWILIGENIMAGVMYTKNLVTGKAQLRDAWGGGSGMGSGYVPPTMAPPTEQSRLAPAPSTS